MLFRTRAQQQERPYDNREKIKAYLSKYNEVTLDLELIAIIIAEFKSLKSADFLFS